MGQTNPILCPYCGAEMYVRTVFSGGIYSTWYECLDCDASSPMYRAPDQIDAIYGGAELAQRRYVPPIKPMTLEEILSTKYKNIPIWIELGDVWYSEDRWMFFERVANNEYKFTAPFEVITAPVENYNRTWRCWSRRPTDEECMAAAWEVE